MWATSTIRRVLGLLSLSHLGRIAHVYGIHTPQGEHIVTSRCVPRYGFQASILVPIAMNITLGNDVVWPCALSTAPGSPRFMKSIGVYKYYGYATWIIIALAMIPLCISRNDVALNIVLVLLFLSLLTCVLAIIYNSTTQRIFAIVALIMFILPGITDILLPMIPRH